MDMFAALNAHKLAASYMAVPCGDYSSVHPITIKGTAPKKVTSAELFLASSFKEKVQIPDDKGDITHDASKSAATCGDNVEKKTVVSKLEYMFLASSFKDKVVCSNGGQGDATHVTKMGVKKSIDTGADVEQEKKVSRVEYMFLASGLKDHVICSEEFDNQPTPGPCQSSLLINVSSPKTKKVSRWWRHSRRVHQT